MSTPRDLLLAFLRHEPLARVPIWLLFPYHPLGCYADVHALPGYRPVVELALELDTSVWLDRRHFSAPLFTEAVTHGGEEIVREGARVRRDFMRHGKLELCAEYDLATGHTRKKFLTCEEDLAILAQFPVNTDPALIAAQLAPQIARWRTEAAAFPMHLGAMMNDVGEPIGALHGMSDVEELSIWSLTAPELVQQVLDRFRPHYLAVYQTLLAQRTGEVFFLVGSELTAPPLVGVETFRRWIVPYSQELIALIHGAGRYVIQHFHGQIRAVLPDFLTMGADALHTIEAPPTGNCTLTEAFAVVGDRIGLIGNIQYDEFHRLTPDGMAAAVRAVLDEARGRRFMLSPTAGPYETEVTPRLRENYLRFMEAGWRHA